MLQEHCPLDPWSFQFPVPQFPGPIYSNNTPTAGSARARLHPVQLVETPTWVSTRGLARRGGRQRVDTRQNTPPMVFNRRRCRPQCQFTAQLQSGGCLLACGKVAEGASQGDTSGCGQVLKSRAQMAVAQVPMLLSPAHTIGSGPPERQVV